MAAALAIAVLTFAPLFVSSLCADQGGTDWLSLLQTRVGLRTVTTQSAESALHADAIKGTLDASVQAIQCVGAPCGYKGDCPRTSVLKRVRRFTQTLFGSESHRRRHQSALHRTFHAVETLQANERCCADGLFDLLVQTTSFLDSHHIPYFVWAGTLLGAVRDRNIIPYTADIDIAVYGEGITQLAASEGLFANYGPDDAEGYGVVRGCEAQAEKSRGTVTRSFTPFDTTLPYIDVYNIDTWPGLAPYRSFLNGTHQVEIRGRKFRAPANAEEILESLYGDWHTHVEEAHG